MKSLKRLEKIWWYIAARWYHPDSPMGKVFSAARKQCDDQLDVYGEDFHIA